MANKNDAAKWALDRLYLYPSNARAPSARSKSRWRSLITPHSVCSNEAPSIAKTGRLQLRLPIQQWRRCVLRDGTFPHHTGSDLRGRWFPRFTLSAVCHAQWGTNVIRPQFRIPRPDEHASCALATPIISQNVISILPTPSIIRVLCVHLWLIHVVVLCALSAPLWLCGFK